MNVDATLDRAHAYLLARQQPDGRFDGDTWQSAASTAQVVIVEKALGVLTDGDATAAIAWFAAQVRPDGSVAAYHGATAGTAADAAQIDAALACCGVAATDPLRRRIAGFLAGAGPIDPIAQLFCALGGTVDPAALPALPIAHLLVPGVTAWLERRLLLYNALILGTVLPGLTAALQGRGRLAMPRIRARLLELQNPDGNWAGGQWLTCMALATLHAGGLPVEHAAIRRGLAWLDRQKRRAGGLRVVPYNAEVWNTAMVLQVIDRWPAAARAAAIDFLRTEQAPHGGWSFAAGNPLVPDTDTTAMVLEALAGEPAHAAALDRGRRWLLSLQNRDGGFAAFTPGQRGKPAGPLFGHEFAAPTGWLDRLRMIVRPPLELVDHATADLTGRVVGALAALGRASSPEVRRALDFLDAQREGDRWFGRWTTNYVAGTSFVICGAAAAGAPIWPAAISWLRGCQHDDGGWGETAASYADPSLAGRGPSNAYATGLAIRALLAAAPPTDDTIRRGIDYLCRTQAPAGNWIEAEAIQTLVPPTTFYTNETNFCVQPVAALSAWRTAGTGAAISPRSRLPITRP